MNFYDITYSLGLALACPYLLCSRKAREKVRLAFEQRMGDVPIRESDAPAIMIHAVSVGEMNATRALIEQLRSARGGLHFIVSTTTQTGYERGEALYRNSADVTLIRYPLDFTCAIARVLDRLRPGLVVLMELEIWPNFLLQCERRKIPVILANGRITEPSFRRYRMIRWVASRMFRRLAHVCAQDELYASRFAELGARRDRLSVTGTMKFDSAAVADKVQGADELAAEVGLHPGNEPIWLCGSTGPGEESIALDVFSSLRARFGDLRLVIVPRHPPRFDEVAQLIESRGFPLVRRSQSSKPSPDDSVVLGDTMGELGKFYSIADVVFVGRSLVDLGHRQHGSDMIEPAALAKPVIVGPFTSNFADAMLKFRHSRAILEVTDVESLRQAIERLLADPPAALELGRRARDVVCREKGATQRHAQIILNAL